MLNKLRDNLADRLCVFLCGSTISEAEWDQTHLQEALSALKDLTREKCGRSACGEVMLPLTPKEIAAVYVLKNHDLVDYKVAGDQILYARIKEEEDEA